MTVFINLNQGVKKKDPNVEEKEEVVTVNDKYPQLGNESLLMCQAVLLSSYHHMSSNTVITISYYIFIYTHYT